jgi:hypothetical protein
MKGDRTGVLLPLDVFLNSFKRDLLQGACAILLKITTPYADDDSSGEEEDYVEGYENLIE